LNIQRLESINLEDLKPFNNIDVQFANATAEQNNEIEFVMERYGIFLLEGDFEYGRARQFDAPDISEAISYQRRITRDSWLRTKTFAYGSYESIYFWRRHRIEFELLIQMLQEQPQ